MDDPARDYPAWVRAFAQITAADRAAIAAQIAAMHNAPRFLLVPLLRAGESLALWQPCFDGVRSQLHPHWHIALPADWRPSVRFDDRAVWLPEAEDDPATVLAAALRAAMGAAIGAAIGETIDFVVPLPRGVRLDERALYEFAVAALDAPRAGVLFGDEDHIDADGTPSRPRFKTGFDPELMLGRDALGLPVAYRRPLLMALGGLRRGAGPVEVALHDLALRASKDILPDQFKHVPVVLAHRTEAPEWDAAAFAAVMRRHLHDIGETAATVAAAPLAPDWLRVTHAVPMPQPLVSVIVPTRDGTELLARCMEGLLYRTDYDALEVLIVDNGSTSPDTLALLDHLAADARVRVLRCPGPFNYSGLNNTAARAATGEVLLLLNNDIDILDSGWLRELVAHAMRPGVGAAGAKLLYADRRVQHAGVVVGRGQFIAHQLRLSSARDPGPAGELALARSVRAVTGACLAIRRSIYGEVGGLDATVLPVALNDIDLCLRLADHGYRVVFTPFAELLHLESASRGDDMIDAARQARFMRELAAFSGRWADDLREDPFHNPNLEFGWDRTQLAAPPRRLASWAVGKAPLC
jgi:GT2 family glycosyltransferase